jgi:hypothetical protein
MANMLPSYLSDLASAFSQRSPERLSALVPLDPTHPAYRPLQATLSSVSDKTCRVRVANQQIPESGLSTSGLGQYIGQVPAEARDNFAGFVVALLKFIRLPDGGGFEQVHAKYSGLVAAYT